MVPAEMFAALRAHVRRWHAMVTKGRADRHSSTRPGSSIPRGMVAIAAILAALLPGSAGADRKRLVRPQSPQLRYLIAYDSGLKGDWTTTVWDDPDHKVMVDTGAAAPGRQGTSIEVRFSQNGWGAFGLANMKDWSSVRYMYLNEFRTIELDLYIEPDATGMENLRFILDDAGRSSDPALVSFIAGWDPTRPEQSAGRWIPVRIDLTKVGATTHRFMRFLFQNSAGSSRPHFRIANVRLGWREDTTPAAFSSVTATPSLTFDSLTLTFTTDKATTSRVEYGIDAYDRVVEGGEPVPALNHEVRLQGLSRGNTYRYRITAWSHRSDPSLPPIPGYYTGSYTMPPMATAPPVISSFTASPAEIAAGQNSRLTWAVSDYDALAIDQGVGSVASIPGTAGVLVRPLQTTTYTITATNAIGTVSRGVTVVTHPVPVVRSFTATPLKIGAGSTAVLTWDVGDADRVSIDRGVGDVSGIAGGTGVTITATGTTTYVLTASNARGEARDAATVTVAHPPRNPVWVMGYYVGYHRGDQPPDKVDYRTMTHIMVGAVVPRTDGSLDTGFYLGDPAGPAWAKETVQRAHGAGIKAILMVGGAGAIDGFRATAAAAVRQALVSSLKAIVVEYGFDGIDLDWEPLVPADRETILALLAALQAPEVLPRSSYLYTLPVGWNNANFNDMAHPFYGELAGHFDRVSSMSYSMFWLGYGWQSWHSSALYGHTPSTPSSVHDTVRALRAGGVPDAKIGIGIGFYGSAFENGRWEGGRFVHLDPPAIPSYVTAPRQSTETAAFRYGDNALSYSNLMRHVHSGGAFRWDQDARVPYLSFATPAAVSIPGFFSDLKTTYVTYDNEDAVAEKASYVLENGLGGVIVWTISEGYLGQWKTSGETDPLMKTLASILVP